MILANGVKVGLLRQFDRRCAAIGPLDTATNGSQVPAHDRDRTLAAATECSTDAVKQWRIVRRSSRGLARNLYSIWTRAGVHAGNVTQRRASNCKTAIRRLAPVQPSDLVCTHRRLQPTIVGGSPLCTAELPRNSQHTSLHLAVPACLHHSTTFPDPLGFLCAPHSPLPVAFSVQRAGSLYSR